MTNILKQVAGIDVAQKELVVSLGKIDHSLNADVYRCKAFANKLSGFKAMITWINKYTQAHISVRYVMEATGVYHESLAYYLSDQGLESSIVLPNKISNYFRTLDEKSITDKTASAAICQFGLERKLEIWQKPKKIFKTLKQLTRERDQLIAERTLLKNQLHAERAEAEPSEDSIIRMKARIALINKQEAEIRSELALVIKNDPKLNGQIKNIISIPGIGKLTAVIILAETNGFELIRNKKQLVSYSGLDIKVKNSGTSVNSKPRISKKGNRHLRKAMHMPALSAIKHNERFKSVFVRLVSKHGIKMKAAVAVQRKLLEMVYIIWKTNTPYDKKYIQTKDAMPV